MELYSIYPFCLAFFFFPLSILFLSFFHVFVSSNTFIVLIATQYSIAWIFHNQLFHSPLGDVYLVYVQFKTNKNRVVTPIPILRAHMCISGQGTAEQLDHGVGTCSALEDTAKQFLKVFVHFCFFVTNSHPIH